MMIEKVIIDDLKPEMIDVVFELCQRQILKIKELLSYFKNTPSDLSPSICMWLEVSMAYYNTISVWVLFLKNKAMMDRLIDKTKDIETIYFENNLLANAILDSKGYFEMMVERLKADPLVVEYPRHALSFFNEKMERELKKSISTFESVKGDLEIRKYIGVTLDSLLASGFGPLSEDKIEKKLIEEAGIQELVKVSR
jgi:hypothetical protein